VADNFLSQKRLLQLAVVAAAIVPVLAGLFGVIQGLGIPGDPYDSQHRYLSGLLLGIGFLFWWTVPNIEREGGLFRTLCLLVLFGGLARLGAAVSGPPDAVVAGALVMELIITPVLFFWREQVQRMDPDAPPRYGGPWG